jgi:hypothetical protein
MRDRNEIDNGLLEYIDRTETEAEFYTVMFGNMTEPIFFSWN